MSLREDMIKHWHAFKNPLINDILTNLEKIESDLPPLTEQDEVEIQRLLNHCESANPNSMDIKELIYLFNKFPAAYMLYMVHKLQNLNGDLIMRVISYAQDTRETDPEIERFFQRNMVFEKAQLLGRIFSTSRMDDVLAILMSDQSDGSPSADGLDADNIDIDALLASDEFKNKQ